MARRLDYSARYPLHTTAQVYAALSNRAYWDARIEEMRRFSPNEVADLRVTDSGIEVRLRHLLPHDMLPEMARAFLRKDLVITRTEHYGPFGPEVTGEYTATMPSAPGTLTGTMRLFPTDTGATLRTSSATRVAIPLLGPKLEQLMLVNLIDLLRAEAEFTSRWLDERYPPDSIDTARADPA